jgi:glycosyltransferase involved in cell wall biosynthesis
MNRDLNERPWRIAFDARDLLIAERTGVERVVANFIENLSAVAEGIEIVLLSDRPLGAFTPAGMQQIVEPVRRARLQRLFDQWVLLQLPDLLRRHRIDAYFSLNSKFPLGRVPAFTTIHGLEWHFHPQGYRRVERLKQWLWFQAQTRFSAGIVSFAENTRRDVFRIRPHCGCPIRIVPEGVDAMFRRLGDGERCTEVLKCLGVEPPFVLSVCSLEPRKNLGGLLRAFALMRGRTGLRHRLVLVGRSGWRAERLKALAAELGIADEVCFAGYLTDPDLVQIYNAASVFVYPSKYEGFGLPPLEAMACGVPVVTSNRSATGEVAAGAAILIDPDSVEDLAAGMQRVLTDDALRDRLIEAGLKRSRLYSWRAMTQDIIAFIRDSLATRAPRRNP